MPAEELQRGRAADPVGPPAAAEETAAAPQSKRCGIVYRTRITRRIIIDLFEEFRGIRASNESGFGATARIELNGVLPHLPGGVPGRECSAELLGAV